MTQNPRPKLWLVYLDAPVVKKHELWVNSKGMKGARIDLADLDLHEARFAGSLVRSRFVRCDLAGLQIPFSKFDEAELADCNFEGAGLVSGSFTGTEIRSCSFERALLDGTNWGAARLSNSRWCNARIPVSRWTGAVVRNCEMRNAELRSSDFSDASFTDCDLRGAMLGRHLPHFGDKGAARATRFVRCDLRGADITGLRLDNTVFDRCKLGGVTGRPAVQGPVTFISADLSEAGDGSAIVPGDEILRRWEAQDPDEVAALGPVEPPPPPRRPRRVHPAVSIARLKQHWRWQSSEGAEGARLDLADLDLAQVHIDGDLGRARLVRCGFGAAYLRSTSFYGAELADCRFDQADLGRANFVTAQLLRCTFRDADLTHSYWSAAVAADAVWAGATLQNSVWHGTLVTGGDLRAADVRNAGLDGAVFTDCDLRGVRFSADPWLSERDTVAGVIRFVRCDLRGADLHGLRLGRGSGFEGCKLGGVRGRPGVEGLLSIEGCDLSEEGDGSRVVDGREVVRRWATGDPDEVVVLRADDGWAAVASADPPSLVYLRPSRLEQHELWHDSKGAQGLRLELRDLDLRSAWLPEVKVHRLGLANCDLRRSYLSFGWLWEAELTGCNLSDAVLVAGRLSRARLRGCSFERATLSLTDLTASKLEHNQWHGAVLRHTNWDEATVVGDGFVGADLRGSRLGRADFTGCDLRRARLGQAGAGDSAQAHQSRFIGCDLRGADISGLRLSGTLFQDCKLAGVLGKPTIEGPVTITGADLSEAGDGSRIVDGAELLRDWGATP